MSGRITIILYVLAVLFVCTNETTFASQVTVNGNVVFLDTYETDTVGSGPAPADIGQWGWTGGTVQDYDACEGAKHLEIKNETNPAGPYAGPTSQGDVVHFTTMIKLPDQFSTWWDWQFHATNAAEDVRLWNLCFATGDFDTGQVYEAGRILYQDENLEWTESNTRLTPGQWDRLDIEYVNGSDTMTLQVNGGPVETISTRGGSVCNLAYYKYVGNADSRPNVTLWDAPEYGKASTPHPADGNEAPSLNVILHWTPGLYAADVNGHEIYLGTDYDAVDQADNTDTTGIYRGAQNRDANSYGLIFLEAGRQYFWRIDEVNDSHPDHLWKGKIWSFSTMAGRAGNPYPKDGELFAKRNTVLHWSPGAWAASHRVYLGTSFDDVNNRETSVYLGRVDTNSLDPNGLQLWQNYYWAIDAVNEPNVYQGHIWSFSTKHDMNQLGRLVGPWQLFVDDYLVAEKSNVQRTYHEFNKYSGNPVMVADKPWEPVPLLGAGTTLPQVDGSGYRMWYGSIASLLGGVRYLYATSEDGINWFKPNIGIVEFEGSTNNNIYIDRPLDSGCINVIHTPWEDDPGKEYKHINYDYGRSDPNYPISGYYGAYSPDGLHWTDVPDYPVLPGPGDVGVFSWDPHTRRYIGYPKKFANIRGYRRRCVGFSATENFESWPPYQLILTPDEYDDRWVTGGDQHTDLYGLNGFAYESMYIGFLWIFRITDGVNDGPIFVELVSSRDGINWLREEPPRPPILPLGPDGSWDDGMNTISVKPIVEGDKMKIWYTGRSITHGENAPDFQYSIGLATLRKDGFASLDASTSTGTVTTRVLQNVNVDVKGRLFVNADAYGGSLKVEVLDETGAVISGFSKDEADVITSDSTRQKVTWNGSHDISCLYGRPIALKFYMNNCRLYSFAFLQTADINNDGYIDWLDLAQLAAKWLHTEPPEEIPQDINTDGTVNFDDFAEFAEKCKP